MQNLVDQKALEEKNSAALCASWENSSAFSIVDLHAALACQMDWGVSDVFDALPGLSAEKYEETEQKTNPFSFLSSHASGVFVEERLSAIGNSSQKKPLSQTARALLDAPPKVNIARAPVSQISIKDLTLKLQETQTIEDALACARSFGGAGLAQTALNDIKGATGIKGGGFFVSSEISQESERAGKILVGDEGLLMRRLFLSVGLSLEALGSAPALPWRPPGGRDPLPEEVEACVPLLKRMIVLNAPKWIVTFGSLSARMLLDNVPQDETEGGVKRFLRPSFRLSSVRGRWHKVSFLGMEEKINIFPLISPARLKNSARMRQSMWQDLQVFKQGLAEISEREK
ncbi:hypothetical protein FAI41_08150 [Acetobacteraceae bacterium]|nr:hypothetical protein FAI41_08150 [Acetobacteraceae bacterium]